MRRDEVVKARLMLRLTGTGDPDDVLAQHTCGTIEDKDEAGV